jgi:RNA polymerase sigma-70 factor (ECF subfamily)
MTSISPTGNLRERDRLPGRTPAASQHELPPDPAQGPTTVCREAAETFAASLYAEHRTKLMGYVRGMTPDPHLAEEIVQETMLRAWRKADVLSQQRGSLGAWLSKVARNIMVDHIRRKGARPKEVEHAVADHHGAAGDHADDVVNSVDVAAAVARLSPAHRAVLRELYFSDRTCAEAARVLGVPVGTVKSRLFYALRQLRQALEQERLAQERLDRGPEPTRISQGSRQV